jgi:hypothetical protein
MDYARYNYIAQPGDKNIRFVRQLGPYDDYAIEWGYRYFPSSTPEQEREILESFVDERSTNPQFMFGGRGNDPNAQTEDIGDNSVKASTYGLSNLKIVAKNLDSWTTPSGKNYDDLEELYGEMLGVYRRYIYHVVSNVGGVHETLLHKGQKGTPYKIVDMEQQQNALKFINDNVWTPQYWLVDKTLVSKFSEDGQLERLIGLNKAVLNRLTDSERLNMMWDTNSTLPGEGLSPQELLDPLTKDVIYSRVTPDAVERELQKHWVHQLFQLMEAEDLALELKGHSLSLQNELVSNFETKTNITDKALEAHYSYMLKMLKKALKTES